MSIFELASRNKIRFAFKGTLTVEDLWDLSLEELDALYKILNKELSVAKEESLLAVKSKADELLTTKVELVKHVFSTKSEEAEARKTIAARRRRKSELLGLLADKENEELKGKSTEELRKLIEDLD